MSRDLTGPGWMARHPSASFAALALVIGSAAYLPWVLAERGLLSPGWATPSILLGGLSPAVAATLHAGILGGWPAVRDLYRGFGRRGFSWLWWPVVLALPVAISFAGLGVAGAFGLSVSFANPGAIGVSALFATNLASNVWEEVGWRGRLLPSVQRRYPAWLASLLVGAVVVAWHWPQFAVPSSALLANYGSVLWFIPATLLLSLLFTSTFNATRGNLAVVTVFHASINTAGVVLFTARPELLPGLFAAELAVIVVLWWFFGGSALAGSPRVTDEPSPGGLVGADRVGGGVEPARAAPPADAAGTSRSPR